MRQWRRIMSPGPNCLYANVLPKPSSTWTLRSSANIEHTRFPVPEDEQHKSTDDFPGLVRAADLIGQLADINYLRKQAALFNEFRETGMSNKLKYNKRRGISGQTIQISFGKRSDLISEMPCATFESRKKANNGLLISMQTSSRWSIEIKLFR